MRTSGAGRVLMFSQRNLYELEVWRSGLREFEELIRKLDVVDLLAPQRGRWFAQRKRLALRVGRDTEIVLNAGVPRIKLDRDYDLFFAIVEKPAELLNVNSLEGWTDRCRTSICWLNELWVKEIEAADDARRAATLEVPVAPGAYPPEEADEPASRLS